MAERYHEVEVVMMIRSDDPEAVAASIARLPALPGHRLGPGETKEIRDTYFDTPAGALQKERVALRLREASGKTLVTMKWRTARRAGGLVERDELEESWSEESLEAVVKELRRRDIPIRHAGDLRVRDSPQSTLRWLGLEPVQERQNMRVARAVRSDRDGEEVAELAVDSVSYRFRGHEVRLCEVEIEANDGSEKTIRGIAEALETTYAPALRPWDFGKLATGKALDRLLASGAILDLVGNERFLKPAGIDLLEQELCARGD